MHYCFRCGWEWVRNEKPGFRDVCPQCQAFLHCCVNCSLWNADKGMCTSDTADPVADREEHNFCDEFRFVLRGSRPVPEDSLAKASEARRRWDGLFRK